MILYKVLKSWMFLVTFLQINSVNILILLHVDMLENYKCTEVRDQ